MRKIAIFSNVNERCGVSTYGEQLRDALEGTGEAKVYLTNDAMGIVRSKPDVVIINFHEAVAWIDVPSLQAMRDAGAKILLLFQASFPQRARCAADYPGFTQCIYPLTKFADMVVAHEPMDLDVPVRVIPHGIPEVPFLPPKDPDFFVGSAGFPSDMKGLHSIKRICLMAGAKMKLVLPQPTRVGGWEEPIPVTEGSVVCRNWLPIEETVKILASCTANIFFFKTYHPAHDTGQSGSARMGVAAQRPLILSPHRKFRTLIEGYDDQVYVAGNEEYAAQLLRQIRANSMEERIPWKILCDQGWTAVAPKFIAAIEELLAA